MMLRQGMATPVVGMLRHMLGRACVTSRAGTDGATRVLTAAAPSASRQLQLQAQQQQQQQQQQRWWGTGGGVAAGIAGVAGAAAAVWAAFPGEAHCHASQGTNLCKAAQLNDRATMQRVCLLAFAHKRSQVPANDGSNSSLRWCFLLCGCFVLCLFALLLSQLINSGVGVDERHQLGWTPLHAGEDASEAQVLFCCLVFVAPCQFFAARGPRPATCFFLVPLHHAPTHSASLTSR